MVRDQFLVLHSLECNGVLNCKMVGCETHQVGIGVAQVDHYNLVISILPKGLPAAKSETTHLDGLVPLTSRLGKLRAPHIRKDSPIWVWFLTYIDR